MKDKLNIKNIQGVLNVKVWCALTGKLLSEFTDNNLIVAGGTTMTCKMIVGDASSPVTKIGFGTGTTTPTSGDTALTSPFLKAVASYSYPTTNSVAISWALETTENNGVNIAEYGLFTTSNILFARKIYTPVIAKTTNIRLTGTWTITF